MHVHVQPDYSTLLLAGVVFAEVLPNMIVFTLCAECVSGCATCDNTATCLTCTAGLVLAYGECVPSCPDLHYNNGGVCTRMQCMHPTMLGSWRRLSVALGLQ